MKIRPVGAQLFQAGRRTDTYDDAISRNFAKTPKNSIQDNRYTSYGVAQKWHYYTHEVWKRRNIRNCWFQQHFFPHNSSPTVTCLVPAVNYLPPANL